MNGMLNLVLPLVGIVVLCGLVSRCVPLLTPATAVRVSLGMLILAAVGSSAVIAHFTMMFLFGLPKVGEFVHGYLHPGGSHTVGETAAALTATVWSAFAACRLSILIRAYLAERSTATGGVIEIDTAVPVAYSVPGATPTVVISSRLRSLLEPDEMRVVMEHELAHSELRHDLALLAGRICSVLMPLVRSTMRGLEHAIEREADEIAVMRCGDRPAAVRALAKVALDRQDLLFSPGISRVGPAARAQSLLEERPASRAATMTALFGVALVGLLGLVQWHHVVRAVAAVCS